MKVVLTKADYLGTQVKKPLLPLVPDAEEELTKYNSHSFELKTGPSSNASAKCKKMIRALQGGESVRVILQWHAGLRTALQGTGSTTYVPSIKIIKATLRGNALATFETALTAQKSIAKKRAIEAAPNGEKDGVRQQNLSEFTADNQVNPAIRMMIAQLVPTKALQRVKRYLRRECRKPAGMSVRTYYQHLTYINNVEIPLLTTNQRAQLGDDEIIDILLFATPKSWQ